MSQAASTNDQESVPASARARTGRGRLVRLGLLLLLLCLVSIGIAATRVWQSRRPQRCFARARAALDSGNLDALAREITMLEGSIDYAPHRHFLRGALLLKQGRMAEAVDHFDLAVEHPDLKVDTLILSGQASYQMGRAGGAQQLWEKALELDPDAADAHRWLGVLYYDLGAMQQAILHLKRVAELDPADPRPDRLMGLINKDYERFEKAIEHYRESLRRDPEQQGKTAVLLELAECEIRKLDYASALAALENCPADEKKLVFQAECHHNLGDNAKAQALLDEALARAPDDLPALLLRGTILRASGDLSGAAEAFAEATQHHSKDYHLRYKLAQTYRQLGEDELADEHAAAAEDLRKLWRKFSELHLAAVEQPVNADLRYQIGQIALQLDRPDLARNWFLAALLIDPGQANALEALESLDSVEAPPNP